MKYFADTFYFLALLNPSDRDHRRALEFKPNSSDVLITSEFVLIELADGLCKTRNRTTFTGMYQRLTANADAQIIPVDHELFSAGIDLFGKRPDKEWSLTDCTSFLIMREHGLTHALTADHHFEQAGFTAVLKD
ncbi:MAG TPA: PIN domain-containing protein [Tepidisphaeraceae bacterium]|jgi:hypothetical protein|nr:PIN domain-containing protein [Tepidisphaeraceae bacterium]